LDVAEWEASLGPAEVYNSKDGSSVNEKVRSTSVKSIRGGTFPEIENAILNLIPVFKRGEDPADYKVREMQYLKYGEGDHFIRHIDYIGDKKTTTESGRVFSTSTIIRVTEDLEGGEFVIWTPEEDFFQTLNLDVGETIFFDSKTTPHQINKVTAGEREVLVCWIHKK
jgi:predicted 2-oxoglutarate/Fe(II)-dependent dioxygenase YbiX